MVAPPPLLLQKRFRQTANLVGVVWGAEGRDGVPSMGLGTAVGSGSNRRSLAKVSSKGQGMWSWGLGDGALSGGALGLHARELEFNPYHWQE